MDLADYLATLSSVVHLSDEQLKATTSVVTTIKEQLREIKNAADEKSDMELARIRALETKRETA